MILPKHLKICWNCGETVYPWINIPSADGRRLITYECSHCWAEYRRQYDNDDEILYEIANEEIDAILEK